MITALVWIVTIFVPLLVMIGGALTVMYTFCLCCHVWFTCKEWVEIIRNRYFKAAPRKYPYQFPK